MSVCHTCMPMEWDPSHSVHLVCVCVSQVYADGVGSITFDSPNDARAAAEGRYGVVKLMK